MSERWTSASVADCLVPVSVVGKSKIQSRDYKPKGQFPVIDQGQEQIAGWTDDVSAVIDSPLPLVVFGDHTRAFKFADTPFARGADGTQLLRPKPGIDPRFFFYACRALDLPARGYNRHFTVLKEKELSYPTNCDEQKSIAVALRQTELALNKQSELLQTLKDLKQATMRELFTRGLRGEPQKETEIGLVPESWKECPLGEIADIAYGAQAAVANATDPSIGTLILTNVNLDLDGHINLEKKRYYKVPAAHQERLSLTNGDVLFNWRSGSADHIGKTVYFDLDGEFTYSSFILRFRPYRSVSGKYLFRWLTQLRINGFFTTQRNVSSINSVFNASLSETIPVWFPKDDEQAEIVCILDALDRKIVLHKQKRAVLEELFQSLLHKLMTGEIRVSELDLSALSTEVAV